MIENKLKPSDNRFKLPAKNSLMKSTTPNFKSLNHRHLSLIKKFPSLPRYPQQIKLRTLTSKFNSSKKIQTHIFKFIKQQNTILSTYI